MKELRFIPLVVVAAGLLVYANSFTGPFIFDDMPSIPANPTIRHLWPIWDALSPPHNGAGVDGRPIVNLSLAINYAFGRANVWGYHALNLTIHILAGLTLLGVVRRTLLQPSLRERFGAVANELAAAVAVVWTVHPLQTESVTYIFERSESMMGLFYLLTLYCLIRGAESPRPRLWYGLCLSACALGMASKEVMVSAPLIAVLYDRTFLSGSFREAWRRRWRLHLALAATWIILGCVVASRGALHGVAGFGTRIAWEAYALKQTQVVVQYLRLSVWPHPLVFDYGSGVVYSVGEVVPCALLVAGVLVGTLIAVCRWPAVGFLGAWFFAILAPTSSVMPMVTQTAAEHRMYLPLAAVVVLAVMGIHAVVGRRTVAVVVILGIGLGLLTWRRNQDYRSDLSNWRDTVNKHPGNPRAHDCLADALNREGRPQEAIEQWEQILRMHPDSPNTHYNIGMTLTRLGRIEEGITHYEHVLRSKPDDAETHYELGNALMRLGRPGEAIEHYGEALRIRPDYAEAHNYLAFALIQQGKVQEAIGHLEEALRIKPDYAEAHNNLAIALIQQGKSQEAIGHWEEALRVKPDYAEAQVNLARARALQ